MDNIKTIEQINRIIEKTRQKKIPWRSLNQNLVRWTKEDKASNKTFITTIQMLQSVASVIGGHIEKDSNYVFTIQSTNPNDVVMQINTTSQPETKESIKQLFSEAMSISKDTSIDIINKLLNNI